MKLSSKNLQSSIYTISQNIIFSPESSVTSVANAISPIKSALDTTIKSLSDELPKYQNNNSAYSSVTPKYYKSYACLSYRVRASFSTIYSI